jgi:hypothetical protein
VDREDDKTILDSDRLLRRIPPVQVIHEDDGCTRPSSAAFKDPELSVNIESMMAAQNRKSEEAVSPAPGSGLVAISAGAVRVFGLPIVRDPLPPHDPAHGLVLGTKTKAFFKEMSRTATWVVYPQAEDPSVPS